MKVWASTPEALLLALYGRRVWHDLDCGGYIHARPEDLRPHLSYLSRSCPGQLVFWSSDSESVLISSYPDPDRALKSLALWTGETGDVQVAPAALMAVLN